MAQPKIGGHGEPVGPPVPHPDSCPHCNSRHAPDAYQVGYFVVDKGGDDVKIKEVRGEAKVYELMADPKKVEYGHVYWTREAAEWRVEDILHPLKYDQVGNAIGRWPTREGGGETKPFPKLEDLP